MMGDTSLSLDSSLLTAENEETALPVDASAGCFCPGTLGGPEPYPWCVALCSENPQHRLSNAASVAYSPADTYPQNKLKVTPLFGAFFIIWLPLSFAFLYFILLLLSLNPDLFPLQQDGLPGPTRRALMNIDMNILNFFREWCPNYVTNFFRVDIFELDSFQLTYLIGTNIFACLVSVAFYVGLFHATSYIPVAVLQTAPPNLLVSIKYQNYVKAQIKHAKAVSALIYYHLPILAFTVFRWIAVLKLAWKRADPYRTKRLLFDGALTLAFVVYSIYLCSRPGVRAFLGLKHNNKLKENGILKNIILATSQYELKSRSSSDNMTTNFSPQHELSQQPSFSSQSRRPIRSRTSTRSLASSVCLPAASHTTTAEQLSGHASAGYSHTNSNGFSTNGSPNNHNRRSSSSGSASR